MCSLQWIECAPLRDCRATTRRWPRKKRLRTAGRRDKLGNWEEQHWMEIMSAIASVTIAMLLAQTSPTREERARHPLAPSLPILTEKEIARYEAIVERFIQYDIGKLPKSQGEKAKQEFMNLPPEAFFVLIEGFNRAANLEHSCPAVVIGKKIASILRSTDDVDLLNFAKDTIGSGVKARRHMGVVKDLQVTAILRKGFLQSQNLAAKNLAAPAPAAPLPTSIPKMTQ